MAIYDCFQYFNEDHIVDLRLNILDQHVDYFVISESTRTHQGETKKINFDINKFKKFKKKIIYLVADPKKNLLEEHKYGHSVIEQHQRNYIMNGLIKAEEDDLILISDSDEIPNLKKLSLIKKKYFAFSQKAFCYKLNLFNPKENNWIGTRGCKYKFLPLPQKLRIKKFKSIDVLVNCAGIQFVAPIEDYPEKIWRNMIDINLTTPFLMIKSVLPFMRKNKFGRIINIASTHGLVASVNKSAYTASKHGLVGLTKVVALETAKENITYSPFGEINFRGIKVKEISEKPKNISFINAGIYILKSKLISGMKAEKLNMTDFIQTKIKKNIKVNVFPIHEFWSDIGRKEIFKKYLK